MIEKRRIRFSNFDRLERLDVTLAIEIWVEDVLKAPWATREIMRVAAQIAGYVRKTDPAPLTLREMESQLQLTREDVNRALSQLRLFSAITSFTVEKDDVMVALNLSFLQLLRLIETKSRYATLVNASQTGVLKEATEERRWQPQTQSHAQAQAQAQ
mgnify:CR=1 FL=1